MSNIPPGGKKGRARPIPAASILKPEDVASRPKPLSSNKRPVKGGLGAALPAKKVKLDFGSGVGASASSAQNVLASVPVSTVAPALSATRPPLDTTWREFCQSTTIDVSTFAETIKAAISQEKTNKVARLISAALRLFMDRKADAHRFTMEYHIIVEICIAIKEHGQGFTNPYLQKCLLNLLCLMRPMSAERQEIIASLNVCLAQKLSALDNCYINAFLYDSLGDRHWVDKSTCCFLIGLVLKPYGTIFPAKELYSSCNAELIEPEHVPPVDVPMKFTVEPTFAPDYLQSLVLEYLRKWWEKGNESPPRNLLRTMCSFAGIPEVRFAAARKLDYWIQNGKLQKNAMELLLFVAVNFGDASTSHQDSETLSLLLKMRSLKSKQVQSVFAVALPLILNASKDNTRVAIRLIIANEFGPSQHRYPMNFPLLQTILQLDADNTTRVLAEELSAMVVSREEYCKPARLFTREIIRSIMKADFNFALFADGYFQRIWDEAERSELGIEDHVLKCSAEVITMMPIVILIIPHVKEAFVSRRSSPLVEASATVSKFEKDLIAYFTVCLKWLPRFKNLVEYDEYRVLYNKILFLEKSDYYTAMDQGPSEADFNHHCHKVFGECRLTDSVIWLLVGDQFHTLSQYDVIDVIFSLTKRAVHCRTESDLPLINFSSNIPAVKLLERMLKVSSFKSSNQSEPPPIFVTSLYSRVWVIIIMWICTGKPSEVLSDVYNIYPIFRLFLHMIMTSDFNFPQAFENRSAESISSREKELCLAEEETIIQEEQRMQRGIPSEVNRANSTLLKTCSMPFPTVEIRIPSDTFLNDLRLIAAECRIAANLCRCRSPDLLHKLIENYGIEKAIPAIGEFLATSKGAIESLPLTVLSQFLLFYLAGKEKSIDEEKFSLIVAHLKKANALAGSGDAVLILLEGLSHQSADVRMAAGKALNFLFKNGEEASSSFPLSSIELLTGFKPRVGSVCKHLVNATFYEADPLRCIEYLDFIFKYLDQIVDDSGEGLHEIASSLALLNDKVGDDSRLAGLLVKVLLYYLEPRGSSSLKSRSRVQPRWPSSGIENAKEYVVNTGNMQYAVSSVAVETAISLVCRFKSQEWLSFREEIVKKWIIREGTSLSVRHNGAEVDIFSDSIRSLMLSSVDEVIVQVALSEVAGAAALQMLCTFGLTTYAAGELLKAVDSISARDVDRSKIIESIPFARAYRFRGCNAGKKFLDLAKGMVDADAVMKMETGDQDIIEVAAVPRCEHLKVNENTLTKAEVIQYLRDNTKPDDSNAFKCTPILQSALMEESIAMVVIDHLENNLKFFLENHRAFLNLLMAASYCSDKFPAVRDRVSGLSSRLMKSTSVHPAVNGFLKMFVGQNDKKVEKKKETASRNMAAMSADTILETLNKLATVTHIERARYLNAFLEKRPEIIDSTKEVYFLERQILVIFCGRNGVEGLVSQLPLRCSTDTLTRVLKKILQTFNSRLNPRLVVDFLLHCTSEVYTPRLSSSQLIVLSNYLAELVIREPADIDVSVSLVDRMVDAAGFEILLPVGNVLVSMERSDLTREKRLRVSTLLRAVQKEFPCLKVAEMANFVFLSGTHWRMKDADKNLTSILAMLFDNKYESAAVSSSIESVNQILINHPDVLAREFGVFSNLLSKMVTVDSRTARIFNYRSIITLFRDCCEKLLPNLAENDLDHVDTALQLLITIFEKYFKANQNEKMISEITLLIVSYYLENHVSRARELLFDQLAPIERLCKIHPDLQCTIAIKDNIRLLNSEFC